MAKRATIAELNRKGEWQVGINWTLSFVTKPKCLNEFDLSRLQDFLVRCTPPRNVGVRATGMLRGVKVSVPVGMAFPGNDGVFQFTCADFVDSYIQDVFTHWADCCNGRRGEYTLDDLVCNLKLSRLNNAQQATYDHIMIDCTCISDPDQGELNSDVSGETVPLSTKTISINFADLKSGKAGTVLQG